MTKRHTYAVIVLFFFFIIFRWYIIDIEWDARIMPPEPDDSFNYLFCATAVKLMGSVFYEYPFIIPWYHYTHFNYPAWTANIGFLAIFGDFSTIDVYRVNFYFGIIVLSICLLYLARSIEKEALFWAFSLLFLAFFNGNGVYHGFFWVVPSFYSTMTVVVLISLIFSLSQLQRSLSSRLILISLVSFSLALLHPLGLIGYSASIVSFFIYLILKKTVLKETLPQVFKIILFLIGLWVALLICFIILPSYFLKMIPYGIRTPSLIEQNPILGSSYNLFKEYYFDYFTEYNYHIVFLFIGLLVSLISKKFSLLSIYIGFFVTCLASSILLTDGYRTLVYLWPLTFLLYSYGFYFIIKKFAESFKKDANRAKYEVTLKILRSKIKFRINKEALLISCIIILVIANYLYPFLHENYDYSVQCAKMQKERLSYWVIDKSIVEYVESTTSVEDLIIFADSQAFIIVSSLGLSERRTAYANWDWSNNYLQHLLDEVNGSYLISTGEPKIESVYNLTKAFDEKLSFQLVKEFGMIYLYRINVRQTTVSYPFVYEAKVAVTIADDNQTSFWSRTERITLSDEKEVKIYGENSLMIKLSQTQRGENDFIYYQYSEMQNWSNMNALSFYFYGAGSKKRVEIIIYAPTGKDRFDFIFQDNYKGWSRIEIPLNNFIVRNGNPSWSNVKEIYFRFTLDSPYNERFYIDYLTLDKKDCSKGGIEPTESSLMSNDMQTLLAILFSFFIIFVIPGSAWAIFVFKAQDLIEAVAVSYGLSTILLFSYFLLLNAVFNITVSRIGAFLLLGLLVVVPLLIGFLNKIKKG